MVDASDPLPNGRHPFYITASSLRARHLETWDIDIAPFDVCLGVYVCVCTAEDVALPVLLLSVMGAAAAAAAAAIGIDRRAA